MAISRKIKEYVTLWNMGVSFIYFAYGSLTLISIITLLQLQAEFRRAAGSSYVDRSSGMSPETLFTIFLIIDIIVAGITNFFYTRKYIRNDDPKSVLGFVATISLIIANGYMLVSFISTLISMSSTTSSSYSSAATTGTLNLLFFGSSLSWLMWVLTIVIIFNAVAAVAALIFMLRSDRDDVDIIDDGSTGGHSVGLYADVPTHATGMSMPMSTATEKSEAPKFAPMSSETAAKVDAETAKEPMLDLHGNPIEPEPKTAAEAEKPAAEPTPEPSESVAPVTPAVDTPEPAAAEPATTPAAPAEPATPEPVAEQAAPATPSTTAAPAESSLPTGFDDELTV